MATAVSGPCWSQSAARATKSLDGEWEMQIAGEGEWKTVSVPDTFESQIGTSFDGTAVFRKKVESVPLQDGNRLVLQFNAVATHARVTFNGVVVGEHLGGWTPFRLDVTDAARSFGDRPWEIRVEVDERVGHNTQGFLPIIAPHFGGIWQSVQLYTLPETWIDENSALVVGDWADRSIRFAADILQGSDNLAMNFSMREKHTIPWIPLELDQTGGADQPLEDAPSRIAGRLKPMDDFGWQPVPWTPAAPKMYELKVTLAQRDGKTDEVIIPFAFRDFRVNGDGFWLNGEPVNIRGVLNWGYAPPATCPSTDERFMLEEIRMAKASGFNLMKFCLWIPPKRYLELCDELGILAWIEYPTWHPDFSPARLAELQAEYDEFFWHDRNHPSVVLRSLTCETGPSADERVIRALYERCHEEVPGAVVVDDSSWIEWNRVFDFYDDHPYGNNHTWVSELGKLTGYIASRETKPLMLGEAIAADTWTDPDTFAREKERNTLADAWYLPDWLQASRDWLDKARPVYGEDATSRLFAESRHYAMLMRKYQMETFRREVPNGGYVVSVIRDFRKASMGLIDYGGTAKWPPEEWAWHGDQMLLLQTAHDRRSFRGGELSNFQILLRSPQRYHPDTLNLDLKIAKDDGTVIAANASKSTTETVNELLWKIDVRLPVESEPFHATIHSVLVDDRGVQLAKNEWPVWIVPGRSGNGAEVILHPSARSLRTLVETSGLVPMDSDEDPGDPATRSARVCISRVVDRQLLDHLKAGGRALLLPDNSPGSFPMEAWWFLRGGPVISSRPDVFGTGGDPGLLAPREMLVELQHFDLAGEVVRNPGFLDAIDPLVMLWESHDLTEMRTNALLWRMPVGEKGTLYVSALNHEGEGNAAGSFLLGKLVAEMSELESRFVAQSIPEVETRRRSENLARLESEIRARRMSLESKDWKFMSDPDNQGAARQWHEPGFDDSAWSIIRADRHWEGQGHPTLDGWAWYRLKVDIPADWPVGEAWLNFQGVDDYCDVYVNGQKVGSAGDIEKRATAFDLRTSHNIGSLVEPGKPVVIAVAVYDWYGAGGIFRPVELSTLPDDAGPRWLK